MDVLNLNAHSVPVKIKSASGAVDYATVAAKRRVTLPEGCTVDMNWLAEQPKVKIYSDPTSKQPISGQEPVAMSVAPVTGSATIRVANPSDNKAE